MKNKPKKVFEVVYIHGSKVLTTDGWMLFLIAMDAVSMYAFGPIHKKGAEVTLDALEQLFKAALKEYKPTLHPKQILFVANLPEKHSDLLTKAIPDNHRLIFNSTAPKAAMKEMFDSFRLERVPLE